MSAAAIPSEVLGEVDRTASAMTLSCFSVDVEEYFHCEAFHRSVPRGDWTTLERRARPFIERIAARLHETGNRATFFVLGWMVESLAPLLRDLHAAGHEIACHGDGHDHLSRLTPQSFRDDLRRARDRLAACIGARIDGYRAPTFSLMRRTAWAVEILAGEGFSYDSSVFPIHHDRYGVPDAPCDPFWLDRPGGLLELPPLTLDWGIVRIPVGGGGYLRLLPAAALRAALAARRREGRAAMLYIHPWEFDEHQPRLPASALAQWRHRVNLGATESKVARLLEEFRFTTARSIASAVRAAGDPPLFRL